ncbi:hypothetical protein [Flammeovirga sp. OC4]|uniref:hypothetical protein n=1 Tax=Flammeovirga sp. OC4 TaxID=1382345 RepID=UPI0005C4C472|nr:hypothetical protein [Flammeovirga sp. OC4]
MGKYISIFLLFFFTSVSVFAQHPIEGKWDTQRHGTILSIKKNKNIYEGFVKSTGSEKIEEGKQMIRNIQPTKNGFEGEIYSVKQDKWLTAEFYPEKEAMEVKISVGILSKTLEWERK